MDSRNFLKFEFVGELEISSKQRDRILTERNYWVQDRLEYTSIIQASY